MNDLSKKNALLIIFLTAVSLISIVLSLYAIGSINGSEKKRINLAKDIEELKLEIKELKKSAASIPGNGREEQASNSIVLQKKLNQMRAEIESLRKSGNSKSLEDYKKEKNKFLMGYADEVKKKWTEFLHNALVEKGIEPDDIEMIKYDYNVMLNKIRDEQFRWYEGDSTEEDLNETVKSYVKEFYEDMSKSVGDRKASITLGIVFPDQVYRKSLFEENK